MNLSTQLLILSNYDIRQDDRILSLRVYFPALEKLAPSRLILPLQNSMTVSLPSSNAEEFHHPFPVDAPTFTSE